MMGREYEIDIEINAYDVKTGKWLNRFNGIALSDDTVRGMMDDVDKYMKGKQDDK
jgi:hypothetical protein